MSRPIRVGLIGCGNVAVNDHIPTYRAHPEVFQLIAVADPAESRRHVAADRAGLPYESTFSTVEELLDATEIDLLDVCTPQHTHREIALAALERGIHVLCEKPLATVPADAAAMAAAAAERGLHLAAMHNYVFLPELRLALDMLRSGAIGDVEVVIVNMLGVLDLPGNADYAPRWRHDPAVAGGGVLVDMLHAVYVAEALLGRPIERVSGWTRSRSGTAGIEDIALCRFEARDAAAIVNVGWGSGAGGIDVSGTRGRLAIRYRGGGTGPFEPLESVTVTTPDGCRSLVPSPGDPDGVEGVLLNLANAIRHGRTTSASAFDGVRVLEAVLAVYASAATGQTVALPLKTDDPLFAHGVSALIRVPA